MRSLLIAAIVAFGAVAAGPLAPTAEAQIRHACSLTHPCKRCPKGEWDCNGKCIPKQNACEIR